MATQALENVMNRKTMGAGRIVNETLNPPTYLRRQKSKREGGQMMLAIGAGGNYFPPGSSNRELVVVQEGVNKRWE